MLRFGPIAAAAALLLTADVSGVIRLRPPDSQQGDTPQTQSLPPIQSMPVPKDQDDSAQPKTTPAKGSKAHQADKDEPLQQDSRLNLVRFVDGELVRVVEPLPAGKKGFHLKAGAPLDEKELRMALGSSGAAVNPGDKAQISSIQFKDREIVVDVNGGGKGKQRLRDRIHLEVDGAPTMTTTSTEPDAPVNTSAGATLYLDFDKAIPDMTPDQLKDYLSAMLDFSQQHSAAVQWMDTLPPDIQQAIQNKRPIVGMDREMVIATLGKPDRKVREKTDDGDETEDWIYGKPPAKTVFVKFEGDKVTQVEQFPQ